MKTDAPKKKTEADSLLDSQGRYSTPLHTHKGRLRKTNWLRFVIHNYRAHA